MSSSNTDSEATSSTPEGATIDRLIHLQVDERRFTVSYLTLTNQSTWFASNLTSFRFHHGAYLVDSVNGELFESVLDYLRTGVFPLFYDSEHGHLHHRYIALLQDARYLGIEALVAWLEEKKYLEAVKVEMVVREVGTVQEMVDVMGGSEGVQWEVQQAWETKQVYVCPKGVVVHAGHPEKCGQKCQNARQNGVYLFETEKVLKVVMVGKVLRVDEALCTDGRNVE